jgi:hypothetical protein
MSYPASSTMQSGGELSRDALAQVIRPKLGSLLVTKLIIPPTRMGALWRARLWSDLDAALAVPLTLVAAPPALARPPCMPAGFGVWLRRAGFRLMAPNRRARDAHAPDARHAL